MSLQQIVNVQISRETTAVPQAGFGAAMILHKLTEGSPSTRVKVYTSLNALSSGETPDFETTTEVYRAASRYFGQSPTPTTLYVGYQGASEEVTAALDACLLANNGWYGLMLESRVTADVEDSAGWAEANKRLFVTASSESDILDPEDEEDIAFELSTKYDHTAVIYHEDNGGWASGNADYADAALLGRILPMVPGSYTAKFKSLAGVSASLLSDTDKTALEDKHCNFYTAVAKIPIFQHGQVTTPEWIDTIVGVDWLQARITERIFGRLVNLPKVPFTDGGIAVIEAEIKAQLTEGVNNGFLTADPAPVVVVPKARDVSANDKNNRELHGVTFVAHLAGAIHYTEIHGTVTV